MTDIKALIAENKRLRGELEEWVFLYAWRVDGMPQMAARIHAKAYLNRSRATRAAIVPKPDPLVEALDEALPDRVRNVSMLWADNLLAAIEKRGGKIVWGEG